MNSSVQIGDRTIGDDHPLFISVEVGTTCNGSLDASLQLIDASAHAGADAIKFMIIGPEYFMSDRNVQYAYECASGARSENMFEMFSGLTFSTKAWQSIASRCKEKGIIFGVTVDYLLGVDLAVELNTAFLKLSSWDTGNVPLIQRMARTGRPLQIDTGPTTAGEIDKMLGWIQTEQCDDVVLVHCSHAAEPSGVNINSVPYMKDVFACPVGFSADNRDHVPELCAIGLGANLIEKTDVARLCNRRPPSHQGPRTGRICGVGEIDSPVRGDVGQTGDRPFSGGPPAEGTVFCERGRQHRHCERHPHRRADAGLQTTRFRHRAGNATADCGAHVQARHQRKRIADMVRCVATNADANSNAIDIE